MPILFTLQLGRQGSNMQASRNFYIAPSILSADFTRLGAEVDAVVAAGADLIHFDVMDNHYVPNLSFGPMVCSALKRYGVKAPIDVHLMVEPVDDLIARFTDAGADYITFHPEASRHIDRSIELIKAAGCKAGLALNPGTALSLIDPILAKLDMLLIMSVNPGFGGQVFIPYVLEKIRQARSRIDELDLPTRLEVDGGIKLDNIRAVADAGADTFVMGSAIFGVADYNETLRDIRRALSSD
jgi:ribulose-phosphate 3-epimerase